MSKEKKQSTDNKDFPAKFSRRSLIVLTAALFTIVLGFILMSTGEIVVSPLLLVIGYMVLIPVALLKK